VIVRIRVSPPAGVLDSFLQDVRFGARILARSPGVTLAVVVTLALGIGANSAIFSLVDAFVLHSLRYENPSALAVIWDQDAQGVLRSASAANFLDWRRQARSFSEIAGWTQISFVLTGRDRPEQIAGAAVTANFFHVLGVRPRLGRTFLPDEDGLENPANFARTAVIGHRLWQDFFGADPYVLGRTLELDRQSYVVVGVLPEDFVFRFRRHQLWIPVSVDRANRDYHYLTAVARLRAPRTSADREMQDLARRLAAAYPKSNRGWTVQVADLRDWLVASHSFKTRLLILFSSVGLVLLIACTNVASLLLARSSARAREVAVRVALGATRARLGRQFLTESLLLALAGGAGGLVLAWFLVESAPAVLPPNLIPPGVEVALSPLVASFTLGLSLLTGILFGSAPALASTRPDVQETLQDSTRASTGGGAGRRFRQAMVVIEVALALVLLAGAGVMAESLRRLNSVRLGFEPRRVLALRLVLPPARYDQQSALRLQEQLLARVARLAGVDAAAIGSNLPLARITMEVPFDLETSPPREQAERPGAGYTSISAGYLETLGIAVRRGRAFTPADRDGASPVAIVNEAFAARYFPSQDPVGQRLILNRPLLGRNGFAPDVRVQIVGVIANVKLADLNAPPQPVLYVPQAQNVWSATSWMAVRSRLDAGVLTAAIRSELAQLDRDQTVEQVGTLAEALEDRFVQPRFQSRVMGALALLSFVLAVVGIYGINAYSVASNRREIGIRLAMGATPGAVIRSTVWRGMRLTGLGIALGLIAAALLGPLVRSVLSGIGPADPLVLAAVALLLAAVAAIACYIPARRATRIDPAVALRQE
jgi:putative ABC transport system permease protein